MLQITILFMYFVCQCMLNLLDDVWLSICTSYFCWAFWLLSMFCSFLNRSIKTNVHSPKDDMRWLEQDIRFIQTWLEHLFSWWLRVPGIHRKKGPPSCPGLRKDVFPIEHGDIPASYVRKYQIFSICLGFEIMFVFFFQKWVVYWHSTVQWALLERQLGDAS